MTKKPTLELTPAEFVTPEKASNIVVDPRGRTFKVEPPDVLAESRLIRLIGQDAALNSAYMGAYVIPAVSVIEMDGEPMPFPMSQRELDAAIQRLGRDGITAVVMHLAGKREDEDAKEAVKN